ncbi:hypothetical protein FSC37_09250 [Piscinibacter aquaticus]|uniref:Uncharacterized protein n=1 Tax=Piscinibacter aquaticus TaxID=392597 RepID=A0A5C6U2U9_9BURK|nr:hypothetical protein FSC37_09250 [Piscinibacter aquaticus]
MSETFRRIVHFNVGLKGSAVPACGQRNSKNTGWSKGHYARDTGKVTCVRCCKAPAFKGAKP